MPVLFTSTIFQLVLCLAVLAIMIAAALYVSSIFRAHSLQQELKPEEILNKLEELKTEGKLSSEEFRTIKKRLSQHVLYEKHSPCPDLRTGAADSAAVLLRGLHGMDSDEMGSAEETKILSKEEGGEDTVLVQR